MPRILITATLLVSLLATSWGALVAAQDLIASPVASPPSAAADWPMYRGNPARTGAVPGPGPDGQPAELWRITTPGEVRSDREFYDYDDKYLEGAAEMVIPADLPAEVADEARRLAVAAYRAQRCDGLARVDFFYEADGRGLLLNEINTMPGFTPFSMFPSLWAATGLPYAELIDELVRLALDRHAHRAPHRRGR